MKQYNQKYRAVLFGSLGIFVLFGAATLLQELIIYHNYVNSYNNRTDHLRISSVFVLVPSVIGWLVSSVLAPHRIKQFVYIPSKPMLLCGLTFSFGSLAFNNTILMINVPNALILRAASILPIFALGLIISKWQNITQKDSKFQIAFIVATFYGVSLFYTGGTEEMVTKIAYHAQIVIGLLVFFVSDTFLPLIQNEITTKYKPSPLQMLQLINKWSIFTTLIYMFVYDELEQVLYLFYYNLDCLVHLLIFGCLIVVGQYLVIDLADRCHGFTVPLIISTRKIASSLLSIMIFGHELYLQQKIGLMLMGLMLCYSLQRQVQKEGWQQQKNEKIYQMESILENEQKS